MITISLDEYGEFEKEEKKPLFIGGLIYDDAEEAGEEREERKRIAAYYRKVIADVGSEEEDIAGNFKYPNALHSNGNKMRDSRTVKPVKKKVSETLPEFLAKGTYGGKELTDESGKKIRERRGTYHIFVMLKSDDGKKSLLAEHANMLARDDYAANRYIHMASSVVNRIIFHNPIYDGKIPPVNIDIATRSTGRTDELDQETQKEFQKQAYRKNELNRTTGYTYYSIMNADIYRTVIAQEMVNSGNTSVDIKKLFVRSIQYRENAEKMEFLYMSDSICSILGFKLKGDSADNWLDQIVERVNGLNPDSENLIFGYDEIDNDFAAAWSKYEQKDLYGALSITFDAKRKRGRFAEHYRDVWFPYLEQRIRESFSDKNSGKGLPVDYFTKSVNELSDMLMINNLDQEKLLYLMQQFEIVAAEAAPKYKSPDTRARVLYKLYDAGVSAFCHVGASKKALSYHEKCKQYAFYTGVDDFLRTNNKIAVCLGSSFEWDKAIEITRETIGYQELVSEMKRTILNIEEENSLGEAKTISQLGQIEAEKRLPEAEDTFRKALAKMDHGSANYKITQSYLLHFLADMRRKEDFEEEATDYFDGRKTYNQRLKYILNHHEQKDSAFSNEYAIYVLLRGLYYFGQDQITEEFWEKLCSLDQLLEKKDEKAPSGHPWEISYKYLELMAIIRGDREHTEKFRELKHTSIHSRGAFMKAIELFGDAEAADVAGEKEIRDKITEKLVLWMKDNYETIRDVTFSEDGQIRYQELEQYFTFMYR